MQYFGKFLGEEKKFENRITQLFNIQYPINPSFIVISFILTNLYNHYLFQQP
jgi:hypothetical protein